MLKSGILVVVIYAAAPVAIFAQQGVLGRNLIVNGGADQGTAGASLTSLAANIPGWTVAGSANVLPYGLPGLLSVSQPSPPDHSFQYFVMGSNTATLTQDIDVSAVASAINGASIKFTASAYLGGVAPNGNNGLAEMDVAFKNSGGQIFSTTVLGPMPNRVAPAGLSMQQTIGLVPPGTMRISVTLTLNHSAFGMAYGAADSLFLQLDSISPPAAVLGPNLIRNPGAELGSGAAAPAITANIPDWSTGLPTGATDSGPSVTPYGGSGWIGASDPGSMNRGVNVFGGASGDMYQDIDISPAAASIDGGRVTYQVSAWLGGVSGVQTPTLTYAFFDWSGKQLATTAQLGLAIHNGTSLVFTSHSDVLPAGTRRVHIDVNFPSASAVADDLSFMLSPAGAPLILPSGVVPVYSSSTTIAPASWISIYGTNLASSTALWNGDFPLSLGGVNVTVDSKPAYLWYVSPTQINLQVPDDPATGTVTVIVTNQSGSGSSTVTLGSYGPSFSLYSGNKYAAAIVSLPVGNSGNSGSGYDYIGPAGALPFSSRPVKPGETLSLYGVGFGPTNPPVPAGKVFSGAAASLTNPSVTIGGVNATVTFAGIIEAGLFQVNVIVPNAGTGDQLLQASIGGLMTPGNVFVTLQ